jgi:hypothetical protein
VRVLLSARDPGAAAQIAQVVRALRDEPRTEPWLAASGVAADFLEAAGESPIRVALADGRTSVAPGESPAPLLAAATALLDRVRPDVVLTGISSLGLGVDEALLATAGPRPTFALQDYPGDANGVEGAYAGLYFVRDEGAARVTRARFGVEALPVGSLRHAAYARLDVSALRSEGRARAGAEGATPVVGFFGQPAEIPGHEAAFEHFVDALRARSDRPVVILREHPKSGGRAGAHRNAIAGAGLPVHDATGRGPIEGWLAACDVVTTCFSHATMDYAYLSAWSREPLGSVVFLLTTDESRRFFRGYTHLAAPDGVEGGLGRIASRPDAVGPLLDSALSDGERRAYHQASRRLEREARLDRIVETLLAAGARQPMEGAPR